MTQARQYRIWTRRARYLVVVVALLTIPLTASLLADDTGPSERPGEPPQLAALSAEAFDSAAAAHLLSRAGFGGSPTEIKALAQLGLDDAVERLFAAEEAGALEEFEPTFESLGKVRREIRKELRNLPQEERQKRRQKLRRQDRMQFQKLRGWWIRRMVQATHPLREKMVLFWHGHFTSSQREVKNSHFMYLQNKSFRDNAFGNFRDLALQIARDPAMLQYLNNNQNNRRKPNENFARELMELFTLGVGNYTEKDIKEAARAFTGWKTRNGEFSFQRRQHDWGTKTFLGKTGEFDGKDIIEILFEQPQASRFIVRKLFTFFAHDKPSDDVIEALAATLRASDFEIRPVLQQLFKSQEFYSEPARGSRIKSPIELVVGTFRLLGMDPGDSPAAAGLAGRLGQNLFMPPNVKGWEGGRNWISTSTIAERYRMPNVVLGGNRQMQRMMRRFQDTDMKVEMTTFNPEVHGPLILGPDHGGLDAEKAVSRILDRFLLVPLTKSERAELIRVYRNAKKNQKLRRVLMQLLGSPNYQLG